MGCKHNTSSDPGEARKFVTPSVVLPGTANLNVYVKGNSNKGFSLEIFFVRTNDFRTPRTCTSNGGDSKGNTKLRANFGAACRTASRAMSALAWAMPCPHWAVSVSLYLP